jgi:hypothetical protein
VVLGQPSFRPATHYKAPRILLLIPWLKLHAHPQNFNVRALSGPTIESDCRYYDLDDASGPTTEICLFQTNDSDLILPNPMVDIYFGSLPGVHRFMPPALWIRRLTFTLDLYLGSTDSRHLLFKSDDSDLLRTIRRLIFTSDNWTVPNFFGTSELWQVPSLACAKHAKARTP